MAEINSREKNPVPGIEYSEIHIPEEEDLGTGTFTTMLESGATSRINPIISSIINEPVFQLMVSINVAIESVTVMLGTADQTPARSRKVFQLPKTFKTGESHQFDALFSKWSVTGLRMNGDALPLIEEEQQGG